MSNSTVLENSASFFNTLVSECLRNTGINVSESVKIYLSELLQFYIFSDHLFSELDSSGKKQVKTLAELYLNSHYSNVSLKSNLKKIGDTSLYISGFFRESLRKKMVSVDYYINMGRQAYESLSGFQGGELYEELAVRFSDLVFVLFQIRKKNQKDKCNDLLSMLDKYMETGCSRTAKDLAGQGINIPFKKGWKNHSH